MLVETHFLHGSLIVKSRRIRTELGISFLTIPYFGNSDDKVRSLQTEVRTAKASAEEGEKAVHDLEMKVKDLEDKWSKSKRINKQKQDKIDSMEAQMESASASAGKGGESPTALKKKIAELESKLSAASGSSALQRENTELKRQVEELKSSKKSTLSVGGRSLSGDAARFGH